MKCFIGQQILLEETHQWLICHDTAVNTDKWRFVCAGLINVATRLIALVQAFDEVAANQEALAVASDKFQDLLKVCCIADHENTFALGSASIRKAADG